MIKLDHNRSCAWVQIAQVTKVPTINKGVINWTQCRIILLFNRQRKPGGHSPVDLFPLEQVTLWALQIALMIAIRSNTPEHLLIHFCPLR